ncbi:MAG: DUF2442 domain-containing protein [Lachnospiraceae bacterium]|nr:DUF2442 domain-containing protein [Lachnospiraceae bacterium]
MNVFEIHDPTLNEDGTDRIVGYLFYFERARRFYVELMDGLDEWDAPALFMRHAREGRYSVDSEWSMKWVRQRIIPPDRQNLGSILKENGLKYYDEYRLLVLSEGRCAQDEAYIRRCTPEDLPPGIRDRLKRKVRDVMPLAENRLLVFFRDDAARLIDAEALLKEDPAFARVLSDPELFARVSVSPGGNSVEWDEARSIPAERLYRTGRKSPILYADLLSFTDRRLVDTAGACEILGVSRQYISQLIRQDRLHPVISTPGTQIFLRGELEA